MRHWLWLAALCAIAVSTAAEARRPARSAPNLAQAATPTQETGGVSAPLPRGNPGDPLARQARKEADRDAGAAAGEGGKASDLEAKDGAAAAGSSASRDTERK